MHDETYIYFLEAEHAGVRFTKVGVAVDPLSRIGVVICGCPVPVTRVRTVKIRTRSRALEVERSLHKFLAAFHSRGEWFSAPPENVEDFELSVVAALNMEIGRDGWQYVEIDWRAHEARKQSKKDEALRTGAASRFKSRRRKVAEFNRYRAAGT